jgi:hypothetical protein
MHHSMYRYFLAPLLPVPERNLTLCTQHVVCNWNSVVRCVKESVRLGDSSVMQFVDVNCCVTSPRARIVRKKYALCQHANQTPRIDLGIRESWVVLSRVLNNGWSLQPCVWHFGEYYSWQLIPIRITPKVLLVERNVKKKEILAERRQWKSSYNCIPRICCKANRNGKGDDEIPALFVACFVFYLTMYPGFRDSN